MDSKNLDFQEMISKASNYFKSLEVIGIIGWSLMILGFILLVVALFL